ncbi:MAG: hypothetical protein ACO1RX_06930 [Candidatus Sericytochromatia bacterium]
MALQPPDYFFHQLNPNAVPSLLQTRGAVLVRQVLPQNLCSGWLPAFTQGFEELERRAASGRLSPIQRRLYNYGHLPAEGLPGYTTWLQELLAVEPLRLLLRALFGSEAYLLLDNSLPRRQSSSHMGHAIPFHQDCEFIGPLHQAVNVWLPLTPAGGTWPGLELCLDGPQAPLFSLMQTPEQRADFMATFPAAARWLPQLEPGDLLLFSPYTLHRTALHLGMFETRLSFELRLISAQDRAMTRSPLIVCDL